MIEKSITLDIVLRCWEKDDSDKSGGIFCFVGRTSFFKRDVRKKQMPAYFFRPRIQ